MRRLVVAALLLLAPATAFAAIGPGPSSKVWGPGFGSSGGEEPYLVSLEPRPGGTVAGLLTSLNLTDTPPGDFVVRPLDPRGVPAAKGVTYGADDDIHVAAAVLGASREQGLAIWDDHPDGEDVDSGPIWVQSFDPATAKPTGEARTILTQTELHAAALLDDGFVIAHGPFSDVALQRLDGTGEPSGEPVPADLSSPELVTAADGESVLVIDANMGNKVQAGVAGPEGFVSEPARIDYGSRHLLDVAAAPNGGWLLLGSKDKRLRLQKLSDTGRLSAPVTVKAAGSRAAGAQVAFRGRKGLVAWARPRPCDGFAAVAIGASGRPLANRATAVRAPAACGARAVYDLELSPSGRRRFVLGWTLSDGDTGHFVYATGVRR